MYTIIVSFSGGYHEENCHIGFDISSVVHFVNLTELLGC